MVGGCGYTHFTDEEGEAQRGQGWTRIASKWQD